MKTTTKKRPVRSYVRREGRITLAQRRALDTLWLRFGVDCGDTPLDLDALFGRKAARVVEIGFGSGELLAALAEANPQTDYLGIEVYRPGIGSLFRALESRGLSNVRVICDDAADALGTCIPDGSLDAVLIFFPDPWPKKRHHKRRLIQAPFVARLATRLAPGGELLLATDWADYAEAMRSVCEAEPSLENAYGPGSWAPGRGRRRPTKFERRGLARGHEVFDLVYRRR